jgi:phosphatidate cytidylyltransferase
MMVFHASLRKFTLRYQFHQLCWLLCTLLAVIMQALPMVHNIYQGLIWFVHPMCVVIANDICAYFAGTFFGKTKLIALSPNKTVEGFIGGAILTIFLGMMIADKLQNYERFTCPQLDLTFTPFVTLTCPRATTFVRRDVSIPGLGTWQLSPMHAHGAAFAVFASTIGPFGGFFASGFKRAFKVKDFSDKFPGHGGVMDRVDCMVVMGMFSAVYLWTFVLPKEVTVDVLLKNIGRLSISEQQGVYETLRLALEARGVEGLPA